MKTQHTITNKKESELKFPIFLAVLSPQHENWSVVLAPSHD